MAAGGGSRAWPQTAFQIFLKPQAGRSPPRVHLFQEPGSPDEEQDQGAGAEAEDGAGGPPSSPEGWPESPTEEGGSASPGEGAPRSPPAAGPALGVRVGGGEGPRSPPCCRGHPRGALGGRGGPGAHLLHCPPGVMRGPQEPTLLQGPPCGACGGRGPGAHLAVGPAQGARRGRPASLPPVPLPQRG